MPHTIPYAEVYAEQLSTQGRGIPLWYPEPSQDEGEIEIADVGVLRDGAFLRLFNASKPAGHPWNKRGVPDNFEPMHHLASKYNYEKTHDLDIPASSVLQSSGIRKKELKAAAQVQISGQPIGGGLSYTSDTNSHQGAVLALKDKAARKTNECKRAFREYMNQNIIHWCDFANEKLRMDIQQEEILFVSGWTKTTASWHIAAFYEQTESRGSVITGQIYGVIGVELSRKTTDGDSLTIQQRIGRNMQTQLPQADVAEDQCIFLVTHKMKKRRWWPFKMYAAAGADKLPYPDSDNDTMSTVLATDSQRAHSPEDEQPSSSFSYTGPCDAVLDYILKHSNADVAIASETDIDDIVLSEDWPDDVAAYLEDHLPEIEVNNGVGALSLIAAVRKARMHETQAHASTVTTGDETKNTETSLSAQLTTKVVEDGTLLIASATGESKTMAWPHIVLDENLTGQTLTCMSVSQAGTWLAAGGEEGHVSVWKYTAGELEMTYKEQEEPIWAVAMSYNGPKIAAGGASKLAWIWDIEDPSRRTVLDGHDGDIVAIAWSKNDRFVATGSADASVRLWDPNTGTPLHTLRDHEGPVLILEFSPDSTRLVTFTDTVGRVWDTASGDRLCTLNGHEAAIHSISFSPDGDRIASCSEDGTYRIWSVDGGEELVTFHEHDGPVYSVTFSPDGKDIASGSYDERVIVCDSYSAERRHSFDGHSSAVNTVTYSHSGRFIASGCSDGNIKVWDTALGDVLAEFQGHEDMIKNIAFTPDDRDIVSRSEDRSIRVWCLRDVLRFL